jgi:hypothetical protein
MIPIRGIAVAPFGDHQLLANEQVRLVLPISRDGLGGAAMVAAAGMRSHPGTQ